MTNVKYNGIVGDADHGTLGFGHAVTPSCTEKDESMYALFKKSFLVWLDNTTHNRHKIHTPRKHIVPGGYHDPEYYQAVECARVNMHGTYNPEIHDYIFNGYGIHEEGYNFHNDICSKVHIGLRHYMYPHYFVGKDLLNMLI